MKVAAGTSPHSSAATSCSTMAARILQLAATAEIITVARPTIAEMRTTAVAGTGNQMSAAAPISIATDQILWMRCSIMAGTRC